jgi:hypothetical protein
MSSHHAKAGNILASLDNFLAETVEGARTPFNPHSPTPGRDVTMVNGMASVDTGCKQCHGGKVALEATDGSLITVDELKPDESGKPTNTDIVAKIPVGSQLAQYGNRPSEPGRIPRILLGVSLPT